MLITLVLDLVLTVILNIYGNIEIISLKYKYYTYFLLDYKIFYLKLINLKIYF